MVSVPVVVHENVQGAQRLAARPLGRDTAQVRAGFPCSIRYQPGNPQNSLVVAEKWSGLRASLPQFPAFEEPEPMDLSHLRPGRG